MKAALRKGLLLLLILLLSACGSSSSSDGNNNNTNGGGSGAVGVVFTDVFFASGITGDDQPLGTSDQFPAGTPIVYAFGTWSGMTEGVSATSFWFIDGDETARDVFDWSLGTGGTNWVATISGDAGLPAGTYRWELHVGGSMVAGGTFTVA